MKAFPRMDRKMYLQKSKRGRTLEEKIIDKFLLLVLVDDIDEGIGDTKIQKLAYLSERIMNIQNYKGFNYNFIRMPYGPFSRDLENDIKDLESCGVITHLSHVVAPRGRRVLKSFTHLILENHKILDTIRNVNRKYSQIPRDDLVDYVHSLPNPIRPSITINDTKHGSYILKKIRGPYSLTFTIDESDMASLEIYLDPKTLGSVLSSLREAKNTPSVKFNDVLDIV